MNILRRITQACLLNAPSHDLLLHGAGREELVHLDLTLLRRDLKMIAVLSLSSGRGGGCPLPPGGGGGGSGGGRPCLGAASLRRLGRLLVKWRLLLINIV